MCYSLGIPGNVGRNDYNLHTWPERLLPFVEANTVYSRICMNAPIFPRSASRAFRARRSTPLQIPAVRASIPLPTPGRRPPSYRPTSAPRAPRAENPFVEGNATYQFGLFVGRTCFGFKRLHGAMDYQGLCDIGGPPTRFTDTYAAFRSPALGPKACFGSYLSTFLWLID